MSTYSTISPQSQTTEPVSAKEVLPVQEQLQNEPDLQLLQKNSIQFKLAIGAPDDPLEHEADSMADTIMRMPEQNFIEGKCSHCEDEEKVQRKPLASFIQRKDSSAEAVASENINSQINSGWGSGSNMDMPTKSFMESRFGADFSTVKIHTGNDSIQMNRELNAKAFTVGNDIYFNEGQYNPNSNEGKHLLAHELTHTVQQGGRSKNIQKAEDKPKPAKDAKTGEIKYQFLGKWYEQKHFDFFSNAGYETMKASLNEGFSMMGALFIIALITTESGWGKGNGGEEYHNLFSIMGGAEENIGTAHGNLRKFSSYEEGFKEGFIKRIVDGADAAGKAKFPDVRSTLSKKEFTIEQANQAFGQFTYYSPGKRYSYDGDGSVNWAKKYFNDIKRTTVPFIRNELSAKIDISQKLMQMIPDADQIFIAEDITKMNGWQADVTATETATINQLAAVKK